MNTKLRLPLLLALTIALASCGDDKDHNYTGMGSDTGGGLPGDTLNTGGGDANGIPPAARGNFNPNDADYQTLASDTIYFDFDKSTIGGEERGKLQAVADWFKANPGDSLSSPAMPTSAARRNIIEPSVNGGPCRCASISSVSASRPTLFSPTATARIVPPWMVTRKKPTPRIAASKSA